MVMARDVVIGLSWIAGRSCEISGGLVMAQIDRLEPSSAKTAPSDGTHRQKEDYPWAIQLVDHPPRFESKAFRAAKEAAKAILDEISLAELPYGPGPWEMHHGSSYWVKGEKGWRLYRGREGIEWSTQFCADPAKVDRLREDARELVEAFPLTLPALVELGYKDAGYLLEHKITTADDVAAWTEIRSYGPVLFRELLDVVAPDVLFATEAEWEMLGGAYLTAPTGVIKRGARGCVVVTEDARLDLSPVDADVVDTTGAGDALAAGFLLGGSLEDAARRGLEAAARCVANVGSLP